jgi:GNAT superfamily N-acetyltransferase
VIDNIRVQHLDAHEATEQRDDIIALYERVWLSGWKDDNPFFSRERFVDRLDKHLAAPDFGLVTVRLGDQLIGYIYGFARQREDMLIVAELMVAPEYRRQGLARLLHNELLGHRAEKTAQLLVEKDNTPAQAAYRAWGWRKAGDLQPFADAPNYDVMVRDLPISTAL